MYYELYKIPDIKQEEQDKLVFNPYNSKMMIEKTLEQEMFEDDEELVLEINDNVYS